EDQPLRPEKIVVSARWANRGRSAWASSASTADSPIPTTDSAASSPASDSLSKRGGNQISVSLSTQVSVAASYSPLSSPMIRIGSACATFWIAPADSGESAWGSYVYSVFLTDFVITIGCELTPM